MTYGSSRRFILAGIFSLAVAGCAKPPPPIDSYCKVYNRVLPDADEIGALKRRNKEAILANETHYLRECGPDRPGHGGPR